MFMVLLRFSEQKARAPELMEGHQAWIRRGFDDGAFLLVGSIAPGAGGAILASAPSEEALAARVAEDPFVAEGVVRAEIVEVTPARADARLAFLLPAEKAASSGRHAS